MVLLVELAHEIRLSKAATYFLIQIQTQDLDVDEALEHESRDAEYEGAHVERSIQSHRKGLEGALIVSIA